MRRVLAISPIPEEGAGCRFRIAQFVPYLKTVGYDVEISPFFSSEFFQLVYRPGHYLQKTRAFAALALKRLQSIRHIERYDLIFLYREAFPIGPAWIEQWLSRPGCPPIVYDFDDAVFLPNVSEANRMISSLKYPQKIPSIVRASTHVVAGNDFLAEFARRYNSSVETIPTCVDTDRFAPRANAVPSDPLTVGWIGSPTTGTYLQMLSPVFEQVFARTPFQVKVSGASADVRFGRVPTRNVPWSLADEVALFNTCDIGVYPLTDDEWSRGKCGFKAIQFMACGVPVVASAVGVNREIIDDGVNGFLASTEEEWVTKVSRLIEDRRLRARFAAAGRKTIEERYSLHVNAPKLASVLERAARGAGESAA